MIKSNRWKFIIPIGSVIFLLAIGIFLNKPLFLKALIAKYKSTDNFITLAEDPRIRYEKNAKGNALSLKEILDASQRKVEVTLNSRFVKPIETYVCASQDSFNEYVFLSKNVRGAVYWGKLFLSPGAFDRGEESLVELTTHELTHYLFNTHLGEEAHIKNIPIWFREGIAVFVADGGPDYTKEKAVSELMSIAEKEAYLSGNVDFWFASKNPADAVTKNGVANWLIYRIGASFVHYMHDSQPEHFEKLTQLLLSGAEFSQALEVSYGKNIDVLRKEFSQYLRRVNERTIPQ
ncbi:MULTISPECIES: hypothetical protein [unclassified Duganella]|uniref:hypothetical protein n=1 Tax=unclassified Duganella TaxID=2636909 RepID=UPI0011C16F0D|nr:MULTISPECIES: hypothetical protein [unclassified Duganella]